MKRSLIIILSTVLICLNIKVNAQVEYDKYFTDNQLRIDYYLFGNADTVSFATRRKEDNSHANKVSRRSLAVSLQ